MSEIPQVITGSLLWNKLAQNSDLQQALVGIRELSEAIGAQAARVIPSYTDHSIAHMDGLLTVAETVLTSEEIEQLSPSETFVLCSSFYVHDLGMSLASTQEGIEHIKATEEYASAKAQTDSMHPDQPEQAETAALCLSARLLHAEKATELVADPIPGLGRYLIESTEIRDKWGSFIADVSASHHWSISEIHDKLGSKDKVPDSIRGELDLGYIACILRVIDYAHINFERAAYLDRLLRLSIDPESLVHWKAQEHITGPTRQADRIVFGCKNPIGDVEAWWLFYELACGLDREIHSVSEYLNSRSVSNGRFSLEGVKGVLSPDSFSKLINTSGFAPVDVRFRPDSIERLVEILGGKSLYGDDLFAPLRELIQNARDAITLKRISNTSEASSGEPEQISVSIQKDGETETLHVSDNGVGMNADIIVNYLLGIASDYWNSPQYYRDFPEANNNGFIPAGRFGIGFLSVFMVGDKLQVQTERQGGPHLTLNVSGVGRRGTLVTSTPRTRLGTTVAVEISKQDSSIYKNLDAIVRARVPMLDIPIRVDLPSRSSIIEPNWWSTVPQDELNDFVTQWHQVASIPAQSNSGRHLYFQRGESFRDIPSKDKWPGQQPEFTTVTYRILAIPQPGALVICSRGIAVHTVPSPGMIGLIQLDDLDLNAARSTALDWNFKEKKDELISALQPKILDSLDSLSHEESIPSRFGFLAKVGRLYGKKLLTKTQLPWVTLVTPPGNANLISPIDLLPRLSTAKEVVVSFGVGPWSINKVAHDRFQSINNDALMIPVPSTDQPRIGSFNDDDEFIEGALPEHFFEYNANHDDASMLIAVLDVLADAWDINIDILVNSRWVRNKTNNLSAHFIR